MSTRVPKKKSPGEPHPLDRTRLAAMIEEALVDAYGESEQASGWFTMFEENLALPFETTVIGVSVRVTGIDISGEDSIVAICKRGRERLVIPLLDLPLPSPRPAGAEWIEAYRYWRRRGGA